MITNNIIENTVAFKQLDKVTKVIYSKKQMMDEVKKEFNIAKTIGIAAYENTYFPRPYKIKVIRELLLLSTN